VAVRALSIHADYGCRSSGACCTSGWPIPLEPGVEQRLEGGLRSGALRLPRLEPEWLRPAPGLPHGARAVLRQDAAGACVFLEAGHPRLCAVHRQLGEDALPSACRQFPRVATLTPQGVSLTLSHYCPTAAALLFRDGARLEIVTDPPAFPASWPYEGLDARDSLPPLLRPGVLMSWESHARFEEHAVATLAREQLTPEQATVALAADAEALRLWTPAQGRFDDFVTRALASSAERPVPPTPRAAMSLAAAFDAWEHTASVVPASHPQPASPRAEAEGLGIARVERLVGEGWAGLRRPVGGWLASKAFASWLALQGEGLRTSVLGIESARAVLLAEAARGCAFAQSRALDASLLKEAVRRADLLLLHLADSESLARRLSRCESLPGRVVASPLTPKPPA
jgi:Fe-S-cluster containining protein